MHDADARALRHKSQPVVQPLKEGVGEPSPHGDANSKTQPRGKKPHEMVNAPADG